MALSTPELVLLSLCYHQVRPTALFSSELDDPMLSPGKSDKVFSQSSIECFLFDLFLSLLQAGLVVLGDNEGDEGGLDSCANFKPKAALEIEQPSLAKLPTKAMCVVPWGECFGGGRIEYFRYGFGRRG